MKARENPFRSERLDAVPFRFFDENEIEVLERLKKQNYRSSVVGPHGSGKTTFLEWLQSKLRNQGMDVALVRATRDEIPSSVEILLLDEAESLSLQQWFELRRRQKKLVVTLHHRRLLPVLCYTKPSIEKLQYVVRELCGESLKVQHASALLERHGGNIRNALLELYDFQ